MGTGILWKAKLLEDNIEVKKSYLLHPPSAQCWIPSLVVSGTRSSELVSASLTFPHVTWKSLERNPMTMRSLKCVVLINQGPILGRGQWAVHGQPKNQVTVYSWGYLSPFFWLSFHVTVPDWAQFCFKSSSDFVSWPRPSQHAIFWIRLRKWKVFSLK